MLDDKAETDGAVVAFAVTEYDGKGTLLVRCSDGAVKAGFKAGELIKKAAEAMGGRGGGKPTFARGGVDASKYNQGRDAFVKAVREIAG
jgi:alanyl-tRNA synthetase